MRKITLNENGLFNTIEDAEKFIQLRHDSISSGLNIENYREEMPIKISIVKI